MSTPPIRIVIDSCVFDDLAETDEVLQLARRVIESGAVRLLATHVQRDQIAATRDKVERARLQMVPVEWVAPVDGYVGITPVGDFPVGGEGMTETVRGQSRDLYDALIGATALHEDALLATNEVKGFRNRALRAGIEVWSGPELIEHLRALDAPSA